MNAHVIDEVDPSIASLINVKNFRPWLQEHAGASAEPLRVTRLAGGNSNPTISIEQGSKRWVLRRPPVGSKLSTAHDVGREYTFYRAMQNTPVPVPETVAMCDDVSVCGAPFYIMKFVDGRVLGRPEELADASPEQRRLLCHEFARIMAAIHRVDIDAVGLGHVAKREGYLERQVRHWTNQWEALGASHPNKVLDEVVRRLRADIPKSPATAVVHGDYRLGNVMVARDEPNRIVAVLDWEMATLGDPLADLGYSLVFWGATNGRYLDPSARIAEMPGCCTADELVTEYVKAGGPAADNIKYYVALAWFKLCMIGQGQMDHFARTKGPVTPEMIKGRDSLAQQALDAL